MPTQSITSREFNHRVDLAKRMALDGPLFITHHGTPTHVLLSYSDFQNLSASIALTDMLAIAGLDQLTPDALRAQREILRA